MLYISIQDFFDKTAGMTRLSREEELALATAMIQGDTTARNQLLNSYLPTVAGHIRHCKKHLQTIAMVYFCLQALERAVDSFDFLQDRKPFSHHLCRHLRQATVRCIVQQRNPDH